MLSIPVPTIAQIVNAAAFKPTVNGWYFELLRTLEVKDEYLVYTEFNDYGFSRAKPQETAIDLPPGFWVSLYPNRSILEKNADAVLRPQSDPSFKSRRPPFGVSSPPKPLRQAMREVPCWNHPQALRGRLNSQGLPLCMASNSALRSRTSPVVNTRHIFANERANPLVSCGVDPKLLVA
jgi:hypothetical protein